MQNLALQTESLVSTREGQITDRFTKAIEQLGATDVTGRPKMEVRLGGIYALERIARDSERDHWPVMEVLTAYVRENSPRKPETAVAAGAHPAAQPFDMPHLRLDIQAVLTVVGRRERRYERPENRLNLSQTDLGGAMLREAHLEGTIFDGSDLRRAVLERAQLASVQLWGGDLQDARLVDANLENASLWDVQLQGAILTGARLKGALLGGLDLRQSKGLTQAQLDEAAGDDNTQLPEAFKKPHQWLQK